MAGSTAFFAPETRQAPESRLPPLMTKISSVSAPVPVFSSRRTGPAPRGPERPPAAAGNRTAARTPPPPAKRRSRTKAPRRATGCPAAPATRGRRTDRPSRPARSAPGGSWSRTSGGRRGHSPSATYGGFETTTAKRPPHFKAESRSQQTGRTRAATPWRAAFPRAIRRAPGEMSVATTRAPGTSAARVTAIAPLPVPTSSARGRAAGERRRAATARSASPSVSGRGMSVSGESRNSLPKKSQAPRTYWSGSPADAARDQREEPLRSVADVRRPSKGRGGSGGSR